MKINELENQLGLSRANIRFYEKEGLLTPERKENGYREYSEADISILKKIIIFRKIGLSLPQIKEILNDDLELSIALEENILELTQKIEELNGALEVCKTMKTDAPSKESFDEEHYWNLIQSKENAGEKFADIFQDYIELEKRSLLNMWGSVFFTDFDGKAEKYGWKKVLLMMLALCILRGFGSMVFWDKSFWEGFSYPFFLFGTISLIILPIFFLHKKYQNTPPRRNTTEQTSKTCHCIKMDWRFCLLYFLPVFHTKPCRRFFHFFK